MLPKGLNLDQELDPFGFIIFTAKGKSQLSPSVVTLLWKTIVQRAILMTRMLEQSAQVSAVWFKRESPAGEASQSHSQTNYENMDHSL